MRRWNLREAVLAILVVALAAGAASPSEYWVTSTGIDGVDYVLLVDCTGTMRYQGWADATTEAIVAFVDALQPGDCITIYGYGEQPFAALPDYPLVLESGESWERAKQSLRLPFDADRTDITRGLELAWSERSLIFPNTSETSREVAGTSHVILLTDGKLIPNYEDYSQYDSIYSASRARLLELGSLFGQLGTPIHTIGLGRADKLDGDLLAAVSRRSGGRYYHAPRSSDLSRIVGLLTDTVVQSRDVVETAAAVETPTEEGGTRAHESSGRRAKSRSHTSIVETASAASHESGNRGIAAANSAFRDSAAPTVHQTIVGILGVMMGFVAIGVQRHQSWTRAFTKPLLKKEIRVKGYLKPIYPPGVVGAKTSIPIENPGLPSVEMGEGAQFASDAKNTLVEFVGTTDGSPPTVRILRGSVKIAGDEVTYERQLEDGDIIEMEDRSYQYLRGTRR